MKTAWVWSGGNLKIAWQVGVAGVLHRLGIRPDIMVGTSAGAIVTGYHAAFQPADPAGWPAVGQGFADFLIRTLTGPHTVATKRPWYEIAYRAIFKKWDGFVDTAPLAALVHRVLDPHFPATGPLVARVCACNLTTGNKEYFGSDQPHFVDAVLASAAEPVTMPIRKVGDNWYQDGGVREIAPLAEAIRLGADRIYCIVCQPEQLSRSDGPWGAIGALVGRTTSMVTTEIVNDDIRKCRDINADVLAGTAKPGRRHIDLTVIRPARELPISLDAFTSADIARMIQQGERDATLALTGGYTPSMEAA